MTDPGWKRVKGQIAHIKGEHPGSARYDPLQSEDERQGFDNLMLLCPNHHKRIDDLLPHEYPVEVLVEMREKHLSHRAEDDRLVFTDDELTRFAAMALVDAGYGEGAASAGLTAPTAEGLGTTVGTAAGETLGDHLRSEEWEARYGARPVATSDDGVEPVLASFNCSEPACVYVAQLPWGKGREKWIMPAHENPTKPGPRCPGSGREGKPLGRAPQ